MNILIIEQPLAHDNGDPQKSRMFPQGNYTSFPSILTIVVLQMAMPSFNDNPIL